MKRLFSIVGWSLVIASILIPLELIVFVSGIFEGIVAFVACFFPGVYLIKIGNGTKKENRLNKNALIIIVPALIAEIFVLIYYPLLSMDIISVSQTTWDTPLFLFLFLAVFTPFWYVAPLIMLIIDYFRQRINKHHQKKI